MRKSSSGVESFFFLGSAPALLLASLAAFLLRTHIHVHKDRVQYGVEHLPAALFSAFLFVVLIAILRFALLKRGGWKLTPSCYYFGAVIIAFCVIWLPIELECNFVREDWMLLAAATIRKVLYLHPTYLWHALDTMDGNFRPLSTAAYPGLLMKVSGMHSFGYIVGAFVINLLGSIVAFLIVTEMGYSGMAAAAASILYMSRDMAYTQYVWVSAIGDALSILFCGLAVFAVLRANKQRGSVVVVYHIFAWACFVAAALSKQSAFALPAIIALLLLIRPGETIAVPLRRRALSAFAALMIYGATLGVFFVHARTLLQGKTPYVITLNSIGLLGPLSYTTWFFLPLDFAGKYSALSPITTVVGALAVIGVVLMIRREPRILGPARNDVLFAVLAGAACLIVLIPLGNRLEAYYGAMFAFWMSIAFGIALVNICEALPVEGTRLATFIFCLLVVVGFIDIRLKQTALLAPGGYVWGTYGMDREHSRNESLSQQLAASPSADTVVLEDFPVYSSSYAAMVLLKAPSVKRILVYSSESKTFLVNNCEGSRPGDGYNALNDPEAYNWTLPITSVETARILSHGHTLWLRFKDEKIEPVTYLAVDGVPSLPH